MSNSFTQMKDSIMGRRICRRIQSGSPLCLKTYFIDDLPVLSLKKQPLITAQDNISFEFFLKLKVLSRYPNIQNITRLRVPNSLSLFWKDCMLREHTRTMETCYGVGAVQLGKPTGKKRDVSVASSPREPSWPHGPLSYLWCRQNNSVEVKLPLLEFSLGQQTARWFPLQW